MGRGLFRKGQAERQRLGFEVTAGNLRMPHGSIAPAGSTPPCPAYFTAPKVRPRTSCFWVSQPITRIGATASTEAADSLAQNSPSGLE
jgi:hypothetical protein